MNKQKLAHFSIRKWQRVYNAIKLKLDKEYIEHMMGKHCAFCRDNDKHYWKEGPCISCPVDDLCNNGAMICTNFRNKKDVCYEIKALIIDLEEIRDGA